jgi:hypothetical protein
MDPVEAILSQTCSLRDQSSATLKTIFEGKGYGTYEEHIRGFAQMR